LLWATAHQIALMLKVRVVLLLPENGGSRTLGKFILRDLIPV
jgi:two-component system sensor histidine kinase KdpD